MRTSRRWPRGRAERHARRGGSTVLRAGRGLLVLALCAATLAVTAARALAATERSSVGPVSAALSYDGTAATHYSHLRVTILRAGRRVYDRAVSAACGSYCAPANAARGGKSIRVVALAPAATPSVILDLYSGGAHCCTVSQIFSWTPGRPAPRMLEHDWGDPGYELADLRHDGTREFLSADDRFAYTFAAFAFSGMPIRIWRLSAGALVDVTRQFPAHIATDARRWLRSFHRWNAPREGLGFLAAWAADEALLGHRGRVEGELARLLRRHELRGETPGLSGARYVARLRRLLRRAHYTR